MPNPDGSLTPEEQQTIQLGASGGLPMPAPVYTPPVVVPRVDSDVLHLDAGGAGQDQSTMRQPLPPEQYTIPGAPAPGASPAMPPVPQGAPETAPAPAPAAPLPPEVVTSTTGPSTETKVVTPEAKANQDALDKLATDQENLARDAGKTDADEARLKQEQAQAKEAQMRQDAIEEAAQMRARERLRDQQLARSQARFDEINKEKVTGPDKWPMAKKIGSLLSVIIGGMARGNGEYSNVGLDQFNKAVADDTNAQRWEIERHYKAWEAQNGFDDKVYDAAKDALGDTHAIQEKRLAVLQQHAEAQMTALGIPRAQQKTTALIQSLEKGRLEEKTKALEFYAPTRKSGETRTTVTRNSPAQLAATVKKPGGAPGVYHDVLTGKDYPVDPTKTDQREYNTAVKDLPKVADAVQTLDKTISDFKKTGAARPEFANKVPGMGTDTRQAVRGTDMQLVRSQYATAMGESLAAENQKKYEEAVPNPPSYISTDAAKKEWLDRMEAVRDKIHQYYYNQLSNAGVTVPHQSSAQKAASKYGL